MSMTIALLSTLGMQATYGSGMDTIKLSSFNIPEGSVTVSGISRLRCHMRLDLYSHFINSGGYMAVQVHVAFSSIVNGSGVFAGGPYHCAEGNIVEAMDQCKLFEHV
jgi:hypothetical protein